MKEPARRWLTFANKDRQTSEQIKDSQGLRAIAAFHIQQMIEKSLKAILVCQGQNPPRIHDLVRLALWSPLQLASWWSTPMSLNESTNTTRFRGTHRPFKQTPVRNRLPQSSNR
ncbi:MAG: HEPN domain-containing protein [Spirochaetia bacterium]